MCGCINNYGDILRERLGDTGEQVREGLEYGVRTDGCPLLGIIVCEDNISKHFIEVTGN